MSSVFSSRLLGGYHIMYLLARHLMSLTRGTVVTVIYGSTAKINGFVELFRDVDDEWED